MTREESETVIHWLIDEWVELRGVTQGPSGAPSFSDFYAWLRQGYSPYLVGPEQCRLIRRRLDSRVRGQYPMARMNPSGLPGTKRHKA